MMIAIRNPRSGLGQYIRVLSNPLEASSSVICCAREERSLQVQPLQSIELEKVYTLGYIMIIGSNMVI